MTIKQYDILQHKKDTFQAYIEFFVKLEGVVLNYRYQLTENKRPR